jgi:DNA-binding IclR family transcriptional regulator
MARMATISGPRRPRHPAAPAPTHAPPAHPATRDTTRDPGRDTARDPGRTAAIDKTMILYEALRSAPEGLRLSDLSRRTGLAKSTAHRLLTALIAAGMVTRLGVGYLAVHRSPDAAHVGGPHREPLLRLAPFVCDALVRTRCTASLAMLDGPDVVFAHRVFSHDNVSTPSDVSGRETAHLTAAGRLLLSCDLRAACGSERDWGLDAEEAARLDGELISLRRRGYAMRVSPGIVCAAVVLPVHPEGAPIVLAAKGRGRASDAEYMVVQLRAVAGAVRAALNAAEPESANRVRPRIPTAGTVNGNKAVSASPNGGCAQLALVKNGTQGSDSIPRVNP